MPDISGYARRIHDEEDKPLFDDAVKAASAGALRGAYVMTGVLQTSPRLRKIQGAVDHFPRTTPVEAGQEFGQFIDIG